MSMMPRPVLSLMRLTPSDTMRSASTSRPESVSSRIAILGARSSICRISWRFFSPPEKPSLTLRSAKAGSMRRASIAPLTSLTHVRSLGASPSIAVFAVRRKLETETPGTSTGYCIARKSPARARSSTVIASTSAPSRVTDPLVTLYFGWPSIEYAKVDLPEPFGPMIAWVSPSRMVRSTPLRISLGPASVSTLTCRSLISSVAMSVVSHWCVQVDEYVVSVDADGIDGYGFGGRRAGRLAGAEVEARAVHPALDRAALHVALGERDRGVRALVLDREDVVALAHQGKVEA